jgi:hypothetical protein
MRTPILIALSAAAAIAPLAGTASAATPATPPATRPAAIPTGLIPFAIQENETGKKLCLTSAGLRKDLFFKTCSLLDSNPAQQWLQPATDADGYGKITDPAGNCISLFATLSPAAGRDCTLPILNPAWTQLANGTVMSKAFGRHKNTYWAERGSATDKPSIFWTTDPETASPFTFLPLGL